MPYKDPEMRKANYRKNAAKFATRSAAQHLKLKLEVLAAYGAVCKCGFADHRALNIDHINGGGTQERQKIGWGVYFYKWLKQNNFPPGYQVLCSNCNAIKRFTAGEFGGR
jgi:hypothetical protein